MPRRTLLTATITAALAATGLAALVTGGAGPAGAATSGGFDFTRPETVASNLATPWGIAALPDGSTLVVERDSARLLRVRVGQSAQVVGTVPNVVPAGEGGLLGLAVSPTYSSDQWVYAYFTAASDNRIVRFKLDSRPPSRSCCPGWPRPVSTTAAGSPSAPTACSTPGVGDATVTVERTEHRQPRTARSCG